VADSCERCKKRSNSIGGGGEFLDQLSEYQLLKDSVPGSYFFS
jgi:hypothetical protein